MQLKSLSFGFAMCTVMGLNTMASAADIPALSAANFPAAWTVATLQDKTSMDLEDGSVGTLGSIPVANNMLFEKASAEARGAAQARDYFRSILGKATGGVELTPTATTVENGETTSYMVQTVNGVRIHGAYATATLRDNKLVYARHFLVHAPALDTNAAIASQDAQAVALDAAKADAVVATLVENAAPALRIIFDRGQAKLAWRVEVKTERPWERRAVFVDAQTGDYLSHEKLSHDAVSGHVNFKVETDCVGGPLQEMPVPHIKWNGADFTDGDGAFVSPKSLTNAKVSLESPFFRVINQQGRLAGPWATRLVPNADNDVVVQDRAFEQLDPFYHLHRARAWVRKTVGMTNSQVRWTDKKVQVNVNINDTCNAFYDGTLNFFQAGDGCLNTARSSNIVYHEYGHGIHDHSPAADSGIPRDDQVGEGVGDYVAATLTNNPKMHGIFSCRDNFRNAANTYTYCERGCDLNSRSEVHNAGQVIAGAWWELRGQLVQRYGKAAGVAMSDRLFLKFLTKVGNMTSAYQAAIAVDDDNDNDPTNGTAHSCEINQAFASDAPGATARFPRLKGHLVPCEAHSQ